MGDIISIRGLEIGAGAPKVCVSLVATTREDIMRQAELAANSRADMVEWRADYFKNVDSDEQLGEMLARIREIIGEKPLLFTVRTTKEGGGRLGISTAEHLSMNLSAINTGIPDLVDVEFLSGKIIAREIISAARKKGIYVIVSSNDFVSTPCKADILLRLHMLLSMGADIPRFSAVAKKPDDLLNLLSATSEFTSKHTDKPVVTVSYGKMGNLSRVVGEYFGSAISFGFLKENTPPGQLSADELKPVLEALHYKK